MPVREMMCEVEHNGRLVPREETGERPVLIYEHAKNGDVFIVPDARLRLNELEQVQQEVSQLLRSAAP